MKDEAVDWCRDNRELLFEITREMVLAYSPMDTGGEPACQRIVEKYLKLSGASIKYEEINQDEISASEDYVDVESMGLPLYDGRPNLVGAYNASPEDFQRDTPLPGSLIINGHADVVQMGEGWTIGQGQRINGKLYGRGSADMKAGLACAMFAMLAIHKTGAKLKFPVLIESVVDEEGGGNGTLDLRLKGYKAEKAIIPEPTSLQGVCIAGRGAHFFEVSVIDENAGVIHYKKEGQNLLTAIGEIVNAVDELSSQRCSKANHPLWEAYDLVGMPKAPASICQVIAGDWPSSTPCSAKLRGTIEYLPGENLEAVKAELEKAVRDACMQNPFLKNSKCTLKWYGLKFPPSIINAGSSWAKEVRDTAALTILGNASEPFPLIVGNGGSDLRLFHRFGIPAVLYGPGGDKTHGPNEFVNEEDMVFYTNFLLSLLLD
jgi:acetylornithine deacetylase